MQPFPLFSPATQQHFNPEIMGLEEIEISSHSEKEVKQSDTLYSSAHVQQAYHQAESKSG